MPYGFGRQLPIIPPSLNDLNLPPNPFNILATMAVVNPAEDDYDENYSRQSSELSEPSPISTLSMNSAQLIDGRRLTRRRMITPFTPMTKPGEFIFCHQLLSHRHHSESWKENWALKCPSQKQGECRRTSARLLDNCSLSCRTYHARRQQTKNSRLKTSFKPIVHQFFIIFK